MFSFEKGSLRGDLMAVFKCVMDCYNNDGYQLFCVPLKVEQVVMGLICCKRNLS